MNVDPESFTFLHITGMR